MRDERDPLERLLGGNQRFMSGDMRHPRRHLDIRREVYLYGQTPFAAILSCSDSRVPVEVVFDQGIGDLFSIRNAANITDEVTIGSCELALIKFEVPLLMVLGHTDCGAIKLALDGATLKDRAGRIIDSIKPLARQVKELYPNLNGSLLLDKVIIANVHHSVRMLLESSRLIAERVEAKICRLVPALYRLETGAVECLLPT